MNTKTIFSSKTAWLQVFSIGATFFPAVQRWLAENPVAVVSVLGAANVLVRFITHGRVSLFGDEQ